MIETGVASSTSILTRMRAVQQAKEMIDDVEAAPRPIPQSRRRSCEPALVVAQEGRDLHDVARSGGEVVHRAPDGP